MSFFGPNGVLIRDNGIISPVENTPIKNTTGKPLFCMIPMSVIVAAGQSIGVAIVLFDTNDVLIYELHCLDADDFLGQKEASACPSFIVPPNWSFEVLRQGGTGTLNIGTGSSFTLA